MDDLEIRIAQDLGTDPGGTLVDHEHLLPVGPHLGEHAGEQIGRDLGGAGGLRVRRRRDVRDDPVGLLQDQQMAHSPDGAAQARHGPHGHGEDQNEEGPLLVVAQIRQGDDRGSAHEPGDHGRVRPAQAGGAQGRQEQVQARGDNGPDIGLRLARVTQGRDNGIEHVPHVVERGAAGPPGLPHDLIEELGHHIGRRRGHGE